MQQLMRRCTSVETYRQTKPIEKERRKAARELTTTARSDTDYENGHPYSSGIYEVLRMERKLTKPKS